MIGVLCCVRDAAQCSTRQCPRGGDCTSPLQHSNMKNQCKQVPLLQSVMTNSTHIASETGVYDAEQLSVSAKRARSSYHPVAAPPCTRRLNSVDRAPWLQHSLSSIPRRPSRTARCPCLSCASDHVFRSKLVSAVRKSLHLLLRSLPRSVDAPRDAAGSRNCLRAMRVR